MMHLNAAHAADRYQRGMTPTLLRHATAPAPRYTSYPTAPRFQAGFDPESYAAALAATPMEARLSLYLHVPFCRKLCWFCGCHTGVANSDGPLIAYAETLEAEIDLVARTLGGRRPVIHLHWGGGTPTILPPEVFGRLMARLRSAFDIQDDAEIAIEIDPRTLTDAMIAQLAAAGVNRASLGAQDFNPKVQDAMNRIQPVDDVRRSVEALRAAGISGVNFDIMYGLPRQSVEDATRTAEIAAAMRPDRIAAFGYAHVPWFSERQTLIGEDELPGTEERLAHFAAIGAALEAAGYRRIGLDHFARPEDSMARAAETGRLRRNFQGYTADAADALIGLGASSIGETNDLYIQNEKSVAEYARRVREGALAVEKGLRLTLDDRLRRAAIERLMCDMTVDLAAVCASMGAAKGALDDALPRFALLAVDGLVRMRGRRITCPPNMRPFLRRAAMALDAYAAAAEDPMRGSRAV